MKQQLLIVNRSRRRAPSLTATDRMLLGFWSLFISSHRIQRAAIILRPSTRFSLHAGVAAKADERKKLDRLYRYIASPAAGLMERLALTVHDNVRYQRGSCRSHEHAE